MKLVFNNHSKDGKNRLNTVMNIVDNTLYIYDYIEVYSPWYSEDKPDPENVNSEEFLKTIRNMSGDITVRINSQGGEVGYSLSIYQTLVEHNGKVTTVVDGYAYSCASWILLAGEDRQIMPGGVVMTHNPAMYCYLDSESSFESALTQWKANRDSIATLTANRTGLKIEDVYTMMDKQTFMNAELAIKNKFCTGIREGKASMPSGVSNYLPSEIRNAIPEVSNTDYSDLLSKTALIRSKNVTNRQLTET
jgi:ATP-dependent Clp protease protease subunit